MGSACCDEFGRGRKECHRCNDAYVNAHFESCVVQVRCEEVCKRGSSDVEGGEMRLNSGAG